mmetsp:Transcript_14481/g.31834  ORF Transcript_14481/g.31834 Transcript_14481/m.31834 type:complete len:207 (+) Transcript_14481:2700-3320(+)
MVTNFSGRIMAWNETFCAATGMNDTEAKNHTIFSLVRPNMLSDLFEIIAAALRTRNIDAAVTAKQQLIRRKTMTTEDMTSATSNNKSAINIGTVTVPCIRFVNACGALTEENPLNMTVSFMDHDNPKNRSFHCVFTNSCKNAFGGEHILAVGSVTAPLLEQMIYRTLIKKQSNDTKASNSSHENYAGAVGNIMGEQRFPQSLVGEA